MERKKTESSMNAGVFLALLAGNTLLFLLFTITSYNTYKEVMRYLTGFSPYTPALKHYVKATFPGGVAGFVTVYLAYGLLTRFRHRLPGIRGYAFILAAQLVTVNTLFYGYGEAVLFVQNVAIGLFAFFLLSFYVARRSPEWLSSLTPQSAGAVRAMEEKVSGALASARRDPSRALFMSFLFALGVCLVLLLFGADRMAEKVSDVALAFFIGGFMTRLLTRPGKKPGEESGVESRGRHAVP